MTGDVERHLAVYAVRSGDSCQREHPEPEDPLRAPFDLDRHRIIESTAFRRLEGKTQVFAAAHHDHFRTRLTHTLEVSQIARTLAAGLRANEPLCEAIALAHDLGHPPFGHAGEAALDAAMSADGGFNHNLHALRVVEYLEHPYPAFRGLNLTAATRAGLAAHATTYDVAGTPRGNANAGEPAGFGLPHRSPSAVEAQIASLADRMAYNCHDLEDAIGAGMLDLNALSSVRLWHDAFQRVEGARRAAHIHAVRRAVLDELVNALLTDAVNTSLNLLREVRSLEDALAAEEPLVIPSPEMSAQLNALETFLAERVYRHTDLVESDRRGSEIVLSLFDAYQNKPEALPSRFAARIDEQGLARVVCDYIAGMTDRFCQAAHARLAAP